MNSSASTEGKASHAPLTVVSVEVPREAVDPLIEALAESEICASSWDDVECAQSRLSVFMAAASSDSQIDPTLNTGSRGRSPSQGEEPSGACDGVASVCVKLVEAGRELGLVLVPTVAVLPEQDWAESWKRFFRVQRVSERIVIRPSWEKYDAQPGDCVIDLDPGMSFGTGNHATTQACLVFLDQLASADTARSVLDMGCGSGILAIAARKLGFAVVHGFDNDPDAVGIARENAADNGVGVVFDVCDLAQSTRQADVVVANILAPVLIQYAEIIVAAVQTDAQHALILSGILDTQYAGVRAAFEAQGFEEQRSLLIGEWRSGLFARA